MQLNEAWIIIETDINAMPTSSFNILAKKMNTNILLETCFVRYR